jgi:hypothetical protein
MAKRYIPSNVRDVMALLVMGKDRQASFLILHHVIIEKAFSNLLPLHGVSSLVTRT